MNNSEIAPLFAWSITRMWSGMIGASWIKSVAWLVIAITAFLLISGVVGAAACPSRAVAEAQAVSGQDRAAGDQP